MIKKIYLPLLFIIFTIISTLVAQVSFIDGMMFVLVQVFLVFLPGTLLYQYSGLNYKDATSSFFSSYLLGYGLTTAIYIICLMAGYQQYVLYPNVIISLVALFFILKDRKLLKFEWDDKKDAYFIAGVLSISYIMGLLAYTCCNFSPEIKGYAYQCQDYIFWMRNSIACSMSYPVHDLSIVGNNLYYHYFSSMHIAYLRIVSGIEFFDLCFVYTRVIITLLTVGGAYLLSKEVIKNGLLNKIAVVSILFTSGFEPLTYIYYIDHIYVGSFGLAEGIGYALFTVAIFVHVLKIERFNWKNLVVFLFAFAMTVGLKAPLSLVLLASFGITCLYMLFNKYAFKKSLVLGISILVVFLTIYYLFVMTHGQVGEDSGSRFPLFNFGATSIKSVFEQKLHHLIQVIIPNEYIAAVPVLCLYVVLVAFMPITYAILIWKKGKTIVVSPFAISLLTTGIVGFILTTFFTHNGMSQMYYWFIGYPCSVVGLLYLIQEKGIFENIKIRNTIYAVTFCGILGMGSCMLLPASAGMLRLGGRAQKEIRNDGFSQTREEMQAMRWLRENTPSDAIVVSNKVLVENGKRTFILSAFSEHQVYLEGYDYSSVSDNIKTERLELITSVFNGVEESVARLKQEGVDYLIVFKTLDNNILPSVANNVIFENNSVKIVAI